LQTELERLNPTRVKLRVTVTEEEFKPALEATYKQVAEQVNIPGFRKGKAPATLIDQRVGKENILRQAINDGIDGFWREAMTKEGLKALASPQASVEVTPDPKTFEGMLVFSAEVEVRPEFDLPKYKGRKVSVDAVEVTEAQIDEELDSLRARFGNLKTVDRPAKTGDFTTIDLVAKIDGKVIDTANNISYEIGSGQLLDGIDEALETLTAGESTTFRSKLVGGDQAGQEAEVSVTLTAVKERELANADDDFAQLASEFDTIAELRTDISRQLEEAGVQGLMTKAREKLLDELIADAKIPMSEVYVENEVHRHLEGEGRLDDDVHRAEVDTETRRGYQVQMLLDKLVEAESIKVEEPELLQFMAQLSRNYGVAPNEFIERVAESGQLPLYVADILRRKVFDLLLRESVITDSKGKKVQVPAAPQV
jgi:trigger factor